MINKHENITSAQLTSVLKRHLVNAKQNWPLSKIAFAKIEDLIIHKLAHRACAEANTCLKPSYLTSFSRDIRFT